ncbi:MAG: glycosyltransferase family 2 protein [Bacillota bacterium]
MELTALVPAYNEAASIRCTVGALLGVPGIKEVVVIDDGSTDDTLREAVAAGARVFRMCRNMGKAVAVLTGSRLARSPYLALVDADLGESAAEIRHLIKPVQEGRAAMTVALFPAGRKRGGLGLAKRLAAWSIYRCSGRLLKEPLSGQRVMHRELLELLLRSPRGFGLEVALTLDLLTRGYTILEVETAMCHRERGRDAASFMHRGRQCRAILRELWIRRHLLFRGRNR